jgi:glycosyltransferase involved in cell wall biosynthesis
MAARRDRRAAGGRPVRLLLAIPYYAPAYAFGGSVTVAETIVDDLVAAGHEVTVATTDVLDEHARVTPDLAPRPDGAQVLRFANVSHRAAAGVNLYAPRGLRSWLRANAARFDVVLLHDVYSAVSVLTARAAERAGVPYALQPLGTLSPAAERGRPLVKRAFLAAWGNRTVARAAALIHSSDDERCDFLAVGADGARLVRLPLPLDLPATGARAEADVPTVAYVGRLHAIKRVDRLVEAIALVRRDQPDVVLDVVGPGERVERELRSLAARLGVADAVRFHGYVSVEEKLHVLARAHVSALLSASEGLPMAALEAMACGTPVVLSEGCHLHEVHERAGLVVPGAAADAAAALARLLGDDGLRACLGEGAAAFAQEFRREEVMPRMIAALERVAARRRS